MSSTPSLAAVFDSLLAEVRSQNASLLPQEGPPTELDFREMDSVFVSIHETQPQMALLLAMGALERLDRLSDTLEWKLRMRAWFFTDLGLASDALGQPRRAIEYYEQSLEIRKETQDRHGEGRTLNNLGNCYRDLGEPRRAIEYYEQSLEILKETQDRRGEGATLNNLGNCYRDLGEPRRAIEYYEQDLEICKETQDRRGEGQTLNNLGICYSDLGEPRRAIEYYEQSLEIRKETQDRRGEGRTLMGLGNRYSDLGEPRRAIEYHEQSLEICKETQDRRGEGQTLNNLGNCYSDLGEPRRAIEYYEQDLEICKETQDRRGEGRTLNNLGNRYSDLGEPRRAIEYYEQSLEILKETQDRRGEGQTLNNLGNCYSDLGEPRRAIEYYEQSLEIKKETQYRLGEGRTLNNLGTCYSDLGEPRRAIEYFEQSLQQVDQVWDSLTDRQRATFLQEQMRIVKNLECAYLGINETDDALRIVDAWRARSLLAILSQAEEDEASAAEHRHPEPHSRTQANVAGIRQADQLSKTKALAQESQATVIVYSYNSFMEALNVYVVHDGQCVCKSIEVARDDLSWDDQHLSWRPRGLRSPIEDGDGEEKSEAPSATDSAQADVTQLKRLYGICIGSIEELIRGASKLVIVADPAASMSCIPFAALVDDSDQYLIQRFSIVTVPCLGALLHLAQRPARSTIPLGESVVVGNPRYDDWRLDFPLVNTSRLDRAVVLLNDSEETKCLITAPCDANEEYEIAFLRWHDSIRKDSVVRVQYDGKWMQACVLSRPDRRRGTCSVLFEHSDEEQELRLNDCLPHFVVGDTVAIRLEDSSILTRSVEGNATICGDIDQDGAYEVKITIAGQMAQHQISGNHLVPRIRVAAFQVQHRPDVSNVLVVPDSYDRYDAGATARLAQCTVSAPFDARGKYEVSLKRWDDLLDKDDTVRVLHEGRWFHGRLLSSISRSEDQDVCSLHVEELGQDREIPLDECMPYFNLGEQVALEAGKKQDGQRHGTICGDLDSDALYEVEMADATRHRIFAKHLVRRMRVAPTRLLTRRSNPLHRLRHAEEEAHTIAGILGVSKEDVLTGEQATLKEVQRRMVASTGVIHLATHGFVDPQVGGRSGVALCGSSHDDAVLTAHAVASSKPRLQSPLVVLSACDTGRGEEVAEGVLGLARAFTIAGAGAVIMSLWEVDDFATRRIMKLFYETWLGLGDGNNDSNRSMLQPKMSVVEAWTQAIRFWLRIHADPEYYVRMQAYKLLGIEASVGDKLTKLELSRECYRSYTAQENGSTLAKELREMMGDLQQKDLSHEKSKYCNPIFWAAFSVVAA